MLSSPPATLHNSKWECWLLIRHNQKSFLPPLPLTAWKTRKPEGSLYVLLASTGCLLYCSVNMGLLSPSQLYSYNHLIPACARAVIQLYISFSSLCTTSAPHSSKILINKKVFLCYLQFSSFNHGWQPCSHVINGYNVWLPTNKFESIYFLLTRTCCNLILERLYWERGVYQACQGGQCKLIPLLCDGRINKVPRCTGDSACGSI